MLGQVRQLSLVLALALGLVACKRNESPPAGGGARPADAFEVGLSAPASAAVGEKAEAMVSLTARKGFHVNAEYPHSFRPGESSAGIHFDATRYDLKDSSERTPCQGAPEETCALRARVPFQATAKGAQRVAGVLAFSVCNPEICLIEKVPLSASVEGR